MLSSHTDIPTEPSCLKNRPFPSVAQSLQGLGIARPKIVTQRTHARSLHQGHGQRSEVRGHRSQVRGQRGRGRSHNGRLGLRRVAGQPATLPLLLLAAACA